MDNEINLFDMLLAKKLGGGSAPSLGELVVHKNGTYDIEDSQLYDGWKKVIALLRLETVETSASNLSQFNLASSSFSGEYPPTANLVFTFNSSTQIMPVFIQHIDGTTGYYMTGGIGNSAGDGAILFASGSYDVPGIILDKVIMLQSGAATDITQYAQAGMTDIKLSRTRIPTKA